MWISQVKINLSDYLLDYLLIACSSMPFRIIELCNYTTSRVLFVSVLNQCMGLFFFLSCSVSNKCPSVAIMFKIGESHISHCKCQIIIVIFSVLGFSAFSPL